MEQTLQAVFPVLKPSGQVAVSDFLAHEFSREFHPCKMHSEVARHGVDPDELSKAMANAGFSNVEVLHPFKYAKEVESGGTKDFEFILVIARADK